MCMSSPKIPTPEQPQEAKMPTLERKTARKDQSIGTVLTGPTGVAGAASASNRAATTLLGG